MRETSVGERLRVYVKMRRERIFLFVRKAVTGAREVVDYGRVVEMRGTEEGTRGATETRRGTGVLRGVTE